MLVFACSRPDDFRIRIRRVDAGSPPPRIENLTLVLGRNKTGWDRLEEDEPITLTMNPGGGTSEITLLFSLDGEARSWVSQGLESGAGYASELLIDEHGTVSAEHCKMPCELP